MHVAKTEQEAPPLEKPYEVRRRIRSQIRTLLQKSVKELNETLELTTEWSMDTKDVQESIAYTISILNEAAELLTTLK